MNRKIINLLFCIFTFFLFSLNCYAHDYDITKYDVEIVVDEHNKYSIKENIDTYFNVSKHGIIRRIPLYNKIIRQDQMFMSMKNLLLLEKIIIMFLKLVVLIKR